MSSIKKIKQWMALAKPNKGYMIADIFSSGMAALIEIAQAVPTAKVVTSLSIADYSAAIFWLCMEFVCVVLNNLCWHFTYVIYGKQSAHITLGLSDRLYKKIDAATTAGQYYQSKEKLMLKFTVNLNSLQDFSDSLCYKITDLFQSAATIIIVAVYNIYVALALVGVVILMYLWYVFINNRTQKYTDQLYKNRDVANENVAEIISGREALASLDQTENSKQKYIKNFDEAIKTMSRRGVLNFTRDKITYAVLYIVITAITIWLALLTSANELTLTMYLVLAPYVASAINYAITGFDFVHDLQLEEVARMRLQTILDMKEAELIAYSNNQTDAISGDLAFSSVSYNGADNDCGKLSSFSLRIVPKSIVLFCGARGSGKRAIFYLLRRVIVPTAGTITMDDINILDFEKDTYKHNLSYTTSNPYFYSESIMDNLLYVCPSKTKIRAVCASLGIEDLIRALPDKYETNLLRQSADISDYLKFMIGLARAVLLDAEFVCIYEFPNSLTGQEKALVKSAIKKISARRAIIIFSAGNFAADICDSIFIVSGGKVSEATSPQNGRAKTTGAVVLASSGRATTKVSGASTTMANTSRTKKQTSRYGRKKVSVAPGGEPWA